MKTKAEENLGSVLCFLYKDVYKSGVLARVPRVRRPRENCPRLAWATEEKLQLKIHTKKEYFRACVYYI